MELGTQGWSWGPRGGVRGRRWSWGPGVRGGVGSPGVELGVRGGVGVELGVRGGVGEQG